MVNPNNDCMLTRIVEKVVQNNAWANIIRTIMGDSSHPYALDYTPGFFLYLYNVKIEKINP